MPEPPISIDAVIGSLIAFGGAWWEELGPKVRGQRRLSKQARGERVSGAIRGNSLIERLEKVLYTLQTSHWDVGRGELIKLIQDALDQIRRQ